jgi:DNA-binding transcriptional ArsR family regulator
MTKKSIMLDLNDPRIAAVASVISNKTCKNILELLAEGDLSESEIAARLKMPINTTEYNLRKLVSAGLVEQASRFFWSQKGKKVPVYRVSGKRIVIEPTKMMKGIIPAVIGSMLITAGIKFFVDSKLVGENGVKTLAAMDKTGEVSSSAGLYNTLAYAPNSWVWFLVGALVAIIIVLLWNWNDIK